MGLRVGIVDFGISDREALLTVRKLQTRFDTRKGDIHAVNSVSFDVGPGELLGVVGESGSGKSVTMMSLIGLVPSPPAIVTGESIDFLGRDLLNMDQRQLRTVRGPEIGFIFQDPMTSLNPVFSVGYQLCEPLIKHMGMRNAQAKARAAELLDLVGIPDAKRRLRDYPHQFSGGMRQRVMIAMALTCEPKLLIADEPTTALDVTIQAQILELIKDLRQKQDMAIIWITHDLGVIAGIADRVMVMYGGQIVEQAPVDDIFKRPKHPYTQALLKTIPRLSGKGEDKLASIEGQPQIWMQEPNACSFRGRCTKAMACCNESNPQLLPANPNRELGHEVACFLEQQS